MALKDDLEEGVKNTFKYAWTRRKGQKVPEQEEVKLGNDGVDLDVVCLYADMAGSTKLVDNYEPEFAAEMYKAFLFCASRIIKARGGIITAYDGDRVMGIFIGDLKNTNAAKAALMINYAVSQIINPAIKQQYPKTNFVLKHGVGVDSSSILVARTGVRGSNDLVWMGKSANHAAKLCSIREEGYPTWITKEVFDRLPDEAKYGGQNKALMWEERKWTTNNRIIYRSNWRWPPS